MAETIKLMASKLGLIDEKAVIGKACEYDRLLRLKMSGTSNMSESAKSIVCLDLAADTQGLTFDIELAFKLAAIKKSMYANIKHNIKKLLNIEDVTSTNSLCVQLGCTKASTTAKSILEWFKKTDIKNSDLGHPQFACMAVYQACRLEKIKVSKSKLIPFSHLKPSQWNSLEEDWTRMVNDFIKEVGDNKNTRLGNQSQNTAQIICERFQEKSKEEKNQDSKTSHPVIEDYEVWKKRILEEAHRELNAMEESNCIHLKDVRSGNMPAINRAKGLTLVID